MIDPAQKKALRALIGKRSKDEAKALFALIRSHEDRTLLAALAPVAKKKPKRRSDPLARAVETALRPLLAPAAEKADMLVEHMAHKHRRTLELTPRGLADAVRRLRAHFSDTQIRAGARGLMAALAKRHASRETVV